ncbi:conserved hypothetical protein [Gammaproteobacteria bacterium]
MPENTFYFTDNSKVKFRPNHNNTFGLNFGLPIDGGTCPGATSGPGGCLYIRDNHKRQTCYMAKIVQIYKGVKKRLEQNTELVVDKGYDELVTILTASFQQFKDKNKKEHLFLRAFYSGDIFSEVFAKAFTDVCKLFPDIQFWLYTRSHEYVDILSSADNVAVYISIDPVNAESGFKIYEKLKDRKNVGLASLDKLDNTPYKFISCPETSGKIKNTDSAGACSKCRLCFRYSDKIKLRNVSFNIH